MTRTKFFAANEATVRKMLKFVNDAKAAAPRYRWFTGLSQLASRLCHRHPLVGGFIVEALKSILLAYTPQACWSLLGLTKSRVPMRRARALDVLASVKRALLTNGGVHARLPDLMGQLFDELLRVANEAPPDANGAPAKEYRTQTIMDRALLANAKVLVPIQSSLTAVLHAAPKGGGSGEPFSSTAPSIESFERRLEVMSSKERPKKLTIVGTDGRRYAFLCKTERRGDLRKDARMMEVATLLNRLLGKDASRGPPPQTAAAHV